MRTYDQLTNSQKDKAFSQAKLTVSDLVKYGLIDFGHGDELSDTAINYYALAAAQGSSYSETGECIIDRIVK